MPNIIVTGNPVDGFEFIGPFPDGEEIAEYHTERLDEWWIASLTAPRATKLPTGLVLNRSTNGSWDGTFENVAHTLLTDLLSDGQPVSLHVTIEGGTTDLYVFNSVEEKLGTLVLFTDKGEIDLDDIAGITVPA